MNWGAVMITKENLNEHIESIRECENCQDIQIKKFSPVMDYEDFDGLDDDFKRCACGKRPIDVVMAHVLKIMIEEGIVGEKATLRRNSPVPLSTFYYSTLNPQFIGPEMLILLHPDFTDDAAKRLMSEVSEVKGVLKGSPADVVGQFDRDSPINNFELLEGSDDQTNVVRTLLSEKLIFTKNQSRSHIEVAMTTEDKLVKLHNYLKNNAISTTVAVDGMCGGGAIGIYLLKYGFEKVIFNDIYPEAIETLKRNLELNEIADGFEIHNGPFEDLDVGDVELCVIDAFPGADISEIEKKAEKIANNVLII
jgi:hypothetical protein